MVGRGLDDRRDRLLNAQVDDVISVIGNDDVNQVLTDVVHVALDSGQNDLALARFARVLHVRLEVADGGLHDLSRSEHERQLHLPGSEQLTDCLHPVEQDVVDDLQGWPLAQRLVQVGLEPGPLTVDDAALKALPQR